MFFFFFDYFMRKSIHMHKHTSDCVCVCDCEYVLVCVCLCTLFPRPFIKATAFLIAFICLLITFLCARSHSRSPLAIVRLHLLFMFQRDIGSDVNVDGEISGTRCVGLMNSQFSLQSVIEK